MSVVARALRPIATMFPCKGYPLIDGRLAQRLERSPHTREVKGSNPLSPTIPFHFAIFYCAARYNDFMDVLRLRLVERIRRVQYRRKATSETHPKRRYAPPTSEAQTATETESTPTKRGTIVAC